MLSPSFAVNHTCLLCVDLACSDIIICLSDDIVGEKDAQGKVEVAELDTSSMASVRKFAKTLHDRKVFRII